MSAEKASAIVIRSVDFSESSSIVTLYTREFGKIATLAKGARRAKSPFQGALDLLAISRIVFLRKSSGGLDLLTEARLERRFRPPGREIPHLYAAIYIAELLLNLTDDYDRNEKLFELADESLALLTEPGGVATKLFHFELCALAETGHLPSFRDCAECGADLPRASRIPFGLMSGGVLCDTCRQRKKQLVMVSCEALKAMEAISDSTGDSWKQYRADQRILGEMRGLVNRYICYVLQKKPRLHKYLSGLSDD